MTLRQRYYPAIVHWRCKGRMACAEDVVECKSHKNISCLGLSHLYLLKPTPGPLKKFQDLTRAEEVVITRLRIGHTKAAYLVPRAADYLPALWPDSNHWTHASNVCSVTEKSWWILHSWLIGDLFETIPEVCIIQFLRETGFLYLIWMAIYPIQLLTCISHQPTDGILNLN